MPEVTSLCFQSNNEMNWHPSYWGWKRISSTTCWTKCSYPISINQRGYKSKLISKIILISRRFSSSADKCLCQQVESKVTSNSNVPTGKRGQNLNLSYLCFLYLSIGPIPFLLSLSLRVANSTQTECSWRLFMEFTVQLDGPNWELSENTAENCSKTFQTWPKIHDSWLNHNVFLSPSGSNSFPQCCFQKSIQKYSHYHYINMNVEKITSETKA